MNPKKTAFISFFALLAAVVGLAVYNGKKEAEQKGPDLTDAEKTKIAQEVLEGKRDRSDLQKYGIRIGDGVEIDPKTFMDMLEKEKASTQPVSQPSK